MQFFYSILPLPIKKYITIKKYESLAKKFNKLQVHNKIKFTASKSTSDIKAQISALSNRRVLGILNHRLSVPIEVNAKSFKFIEKTCENHVRESTLGNHYLLDYTRIISERHIKYLSNYCNLHHIIFNKFLEVHEFNFLVNKLERIYTNKKYFVAILEQLYVWSLSLKKPVDKTVINLVVSNFRALKVSKLDFETQVKYARSNNLFLHKF